MVAGSRILRGQRVALSVEDFLLNAVNIKPRVEGGALEIWYENCLVPIADFDRLVTLLSLNLFPGEEAEQPNDTSEPIEPPPPELPPEELETPQELAEEAIVTELEPELAVEKDAGEEAVLEPEPPHAPPTEEELEEKGPELTPTPEPDAKKVKKTKNKSKKKKKGGRK